MVEVTMPLRPSPTYITYRSVHQLHSILMTFHNQETVVKEVCFQQTHFVLDSVLGPWRLA